MLQSVIVILLLRLLSGRPWVNRRIVGSESDLGLDIWGTSTIVAKQAVELWRNF